MVARTFVLGLDAKVYYIPPATSVLPGDGSFVARKAAGFSADSVDLDEVCIVQDVTTNMTAGVADVSTRCSAGWREQVQTLRDGSPDTTILWQPGNTVFKHLLDAFLSNGTLAMAFLDSDKNPALLPSDDAITGLYSDFMVTDFTRNEGLEEALTANLTFTLAPSAVGLPEWVYVIGTAP